MFKLNTHLVRAQVGSLNKQLIRAQVGDSWAAQYITWLLIKPAPKCIVFFFSFLNLEACDRPVMSDLAPWPVLAIHVANCNTSLASVRLWLGPGALLLLAPTASVSRRICVQHTYAV